MVAEVRVATEHDGVQWRRALGLGFLSVPAEDDEHLEAWHATYEPGRFLGAFDGERCVGTLRSYAYQLTVPGGAPVPADGFAGITVSPTHRRQGLLRQMAQLELARAVERGDAVALLTASEHPIYGRFGFGRAARWGGWRIDVVRSGGLRPGAGELAPGAAVEVLDPHDLLHVGPELHERFRTVQPGALSRSERTWTALTGDPAFPGRPRHPRPFVVVHRDAGGEVTGLLVFSADAEFHGGDPDATLTVLDHLALDPASAAALWRFALSVDWVRHVHVPHAAPDDALPLLLVNPRAASPVLDPSDDLWLRLLDGPAAFAARTYEAPGRSVLEVDDPQGLVGGRWALDTAADGTGRFSRTDDPAELALGVDVLGAAYLGGGNVQQCADAGLATELVPGAAARLHRQLRTTLAPWCPDRF
ncbi:putative acetyltransferase [Motilibacter rhizosphaerae]|uniref:Putative acetyltransferase n=1 Tax=Motilibacter rhizosphaerae TaxID=598652 RepID=A0A4Q7NXN9_9ACTN|nr:GNAT family N-acetyltransferase [Motilibacter rhizosphaerae]RZS91770.1 putative acetyltransferase [Motilibacter rhizosphaerae]